MKRFTDKERLDWLAGHWNAAEIIAWASYAWTVDSPQRFRKAIDAAMKAESKPSAKGAGRG